MKLIEFHKTKKCEATISAVQPEGRFGSLQIKENQVSAFLEKPKGDGQWVSGGFMVCEPSVIDRIEDDNTIFEKDPLVGLANDGQLAVRKHSGFWASMDTVRDRNSLEGLWADGKAPWKVWS